MIAQDPQHSLNCIQDSELRDRIQAIRLAIGVQDETFAQMLGVTPGTARLLLSGRREFSIAHVLSLCDAIGLNLNLLFSGRIDYPALAASFGGARAVLPARYEIPERRRSKARSVQTIDYALSAWLGADYSKKIFSRLQLSPIAFSDSNANVSLDLVLELLAEMRKEGVDDGFMRAIGTMAMPVNRVTPLGTAFSVCTSPSELYRAMHEELMGYFDSNWRYDLTGLGPDGCTVEVTTREETASVYGARIVGTRDGCLCRQGIYMSILSHLRNRLADLEESECMYLGDERCTYHISWN